MSKSPRIYLEKDAAEWEHDGWTSCPNAILRHPDLPWELRAVWAWLASHTSTFELTAEKLRQAGPKGRDWAYNALKELERWGLLTRHREITTGGQPIVRYRLHHRPVPDDQRTYEPSRATPRPRQHPGSKERIPDGSGIRSELGVSSDRRSGRTPDGSGRGTPDGSGVPYKEEKTIEKTNQPGSRATPPVDPVPASPGWLVGSEDPKPQPPVEPDSPGVVFLAGLDKHHRPDTHAIHRLAPKVTALLAGGWSEAELLRKLTANAPNVTNPAGLLIRRLEKLPLPAERKPADLEQRLEALLRRGAEGAQEASRLLGLGDWQEPERGANEGAVEYLLERRPAAAREFITTHREQLLKLLAA